MRREVYLNTIAWQDAQSRFLDFALGPQRRGRLETEEVPAAQAIGRVTAVPVFARTSWPHYHAAAMDGVAVASAEVFGASESRPVYLDPDAFVPVDTGDPLPAGRDAVIMAEDLHFDPQGRLEVINSPAPWENVRPVGEDIVAGEMVVPAGRRLRPADVGAILAAGVTRVQVYRRPRVGIVPSGDELVPAGEATRAGEIPEFDSAILAGLLGEWGAEARVYPPVPDRPEAVAAAMQKVAGECDLVLTIGGSSAGSGDFTARAMSAVGEVFVHGVNTRPGKPVVLGRVGKRPAAGIPGYPVSAVVAMELFVRPLVMTWQGLPPVR
ncbi:MAG TPA: molybdopterin biosynthesis protein, partial [Firmicutes bacterium]|nr:molybdopterin biosynthesis protein [Bacillota bacterium]